DGVGRGFAGAESYHHAGLDQLHRPLRRLLLVLVSLGTAVSLSHDRIPEHLISPFSISPRGAGDLLSSRADDVVGLETEVFGDDLHRRGEPKGAHPQDGSSGSGEFGPAERRSSFDRHPGGYLRRQHTVTIFRR